MHFENIPIPIPPLTLPKFIPVSIPLTFVLSFKKKNTLTLIWSMHIFLDVGGMNYGEFDLLLAIHLKNIYFPFPEATNCFYI